MTDLTIDCSGYYSCKSITIELEFIFVENLNMKFNQLPILSYLK